MNDITNEDLDRFLSGSASAAERERVEAWIAADPSRAPMIEALRSSMGTDPSWDADTAWRAVMERIEGDTVTAAPRRGRWQPAPALLRAAVLAGLIVCGWLVWREVRPATVTSAAFVAAATAVAERDTVALPDGSIAILAPSSRLEAVALDDTVRAFELTGEAFFTVRPDAERPFRVRSAGATTEVLGTEFTVRSREDAAVTVAVREGRVSLSSRDRAITLVAGQVGQVADGGEPALMLEADPSAWLSWLDGVLEFDGARLDAVTEELSRWFGREVMLADTVLAGRRVTGRFVTTAPAQALDALSVTLGVPWAERDGAFVLGTVGRD
jgi:transmembrane sensor